MPFINLPSRDLRDYYKVIKHPVCLKGAQKAVRGIKGREKPTGTTFFKSWQAFEDEISHIWNNAREYNEDGSEISIMAGHLEVLVSDHSLLHVINLDSHISLVVLRKRRKLSLNHLNQR